MIFIWQELLFRPLLNLLIGLYNTIGLENLGLAIVWLTILARLILLPFSLKDAKRRQRQLDLEEELESLQTSYSGDPQVLREEQRRLLKKFRFRKWPKLISLGVQGLILLILYQVFVGGIYLNKIVDALYSFVQIPVSINTSFLGIDIAQKSFLLSLLAGLTLLVMIVIEHNESKKPWKSADLLFIFAYPAATIIILWLLPAVKAVFIITSLLFTGVLKAQSSFWKTIKSQSAMIKEAQEEKERQSQSGIPHPKDRFK